MGHKEAYTMGMFTAELRNLFTDLARYYIGSTHIERGTKIKPADNTPVTDLDNFALVQLRRIISSRFPSDYTLGEEDGLNPDDIKQVLERQDELQWTVDGLDGTWHYAAGTNSYGATIARRFGNKILYAVIFRPVDAQLRHNGFFWAERGKGAWEWCGDCINYHQLRTAHAGKLGRMVVMLEGSSKNFFRPPVSYVGEAETTRPSLSSCIAATTVARGDASALVTVDNKPWDNWPSILLIEEAGGIVTDYQGNPWSPENCGNIVAAANKADHERILRLLNKN